MYVYECQVVDYDGQSTANERKSVSAGRSENIINKCNTLLTKASPKGLSAFKSYHTRTHTHTVASWHLLVGSGSVSGGLLFR